jgi:hypothetical protein
MIDWRSGVSAETVTRKLEETNLTSHKDERMRIQDPLPSALSTTTNSITMIAVTIRAPRRTRSGATPSRSGAYARSR